LAPPLDELLVRLRRPLVHSRGRLVQFSDFEVKIPVKRIQRGQTDLVVVLVIGTHDETRLRTSSTEPRHSKG
jgi:hypothetical protein